MCRNLEFLPGQLSFIYLMWRMDSHVHRVVDNIDLWLYAVFVAIYSVLSQNLFCYDLCTLLWRKLVALVLLVQLQLV